MRKPGHLPVAGLWLLAAFLVIRLSVIVIVGAGSPSHGFVGHFAASRLMVERADPRRLYDDSLFIAEVQTYEPGVIDIFGSNPPTVGLTALPLAPFDYRPARLAWTILSLAGWLFAVLWLARATGMVAGVWPPALLCLAAVYQPALENLKHGQFHVLVLLLILFAWTGARRSRPAWTGAGIGVAMAAKVAGLAFWPMLVVRREWRALAWAGTVMVLAAMASVLLVGTEAWSAFIERAGRTASGGSLSVTAYQSLPGLIRRLTVVDAQWNPSPFLDWGSAGITLSWLLPALLLTASLAVVTRADTASTFPAFAALTLVISPVSLDYHYVLAVFPVVVLVSVNRRALASPAGMALVASIALIAVDLPYRSPRLSAGVVALLAYPKLYGGLILWWLALRQCLLATGPAEFDHGESMGARIGTTDG